MHTRSAEDTLLGFYYQFDKNIFEILNQSNEENIITVEGIEDIDISSSSEDIAMQVKYQKKTKGTESVLRKPISLMLKHFFENSSGNYKYILYGHYSNNDDINLTFTLSRLKLMLKYKVGGVEKNFLLDHCIADATVEQFIEEFEFILGDSFEDHQNTTLNKIKSVFRLSKDEEIETYYSNALKIVYDLAVQSKISLRKISKKEFTKKLNLKNVLFNHWFIQLRGKEKYLKHINTQYFKNGLNTPNIERLFIINTASNNIEYLKDSIYEIEKRFYKKAKRNITSGAPYIFIKNISQIDLCDLKEKIYCDEKVFHDGYCFNGSTFKCKEIQKISTLENKISLKFINKKEELDELLSNINRTKKVFELHDKDTASMSENEDYITKIQVEELIDIPKMIRGK